MSTRVAAPWWPRLRSGSSFGWSRVMEMVDRLGSLVAAYDNQSLNLTVSRRRLHIKYAREWASLGTSLTCSQPHSRRKLVHAKLLNQHVGLRQAERGIIRTCARRVVRLFFVKVKFREWRWGWQPEGPAA